MVTRKIGIAMAFALIAGAAAPAAAQSIVIGPDGVRIHDGRQDDRMGPERGYDRRDDRRGDRWDDRRGPPRREIGQREAVRIARSQGLREADSVDLTRRGWRVEGVDRRGRDVVVIVDPRDGEAVRIR